MIQGSEYRGRRQRLFDLMSNNSALLVFAGVPKVMSADDDYPFEVNKNFYYLTGIDQEGSALLLIKSDGEQKEYLFILPFDPKKERWYGKRFTQTEAEVMSGINNVLITTSLPTKIEATLNPAYREFGIINKFYLDLDKEIKIADFTSTRDYKKTLCATYDGLEVENCYPLITMLRLRKSMREVVELRAAIATTKLGILSTWAIMRPGMYEFELANEFSRVCNNDSHNQGLSFNTIMASGIHTTCLHYPKPLDVIGKEDLVLMDLGARCGYYCADITRTVPANGKFTPEQLKVYNIVLGANKLVIKHAKPGVTIADLQKMVVDYLTKQCLAEGYIKDSKEIINYYFHNVSHFIGLDCHDPYLDPMSGDYSKIPLEPGMIISDEPGLYMEDKGIGVRIEDDLLITENGCEVLSEDIIKEPKQIEKYLATLKD